MKMNLIVITNKNYDSKVISYRSKIENQNARNMGIRNDKVIIIKITNLSLLATHSEVNYDSPSNFQKITFSLFLFIVFIIS